jgi:hypothetical protein
VIESVAMDVHTETSERELRDDRRRIGFDGDPSRRDTDSR